MDDGNEKNGMLGQAVTSIRTVLVTMFVCCLLYPLLILGIGQTWAPGSANGSLVHNDRGETVGSELLAQGFSRPEYFRPRPSAVDYNAAAAGGSNLSPANPELRQRAQAIIAQAFGVRAGAAEDRPFPSDLVTASGSGLDPHIRLSAATYQAARVAAARGLPRDTVMGLLNDYAERPGGIFTPEPVVNVLLVNMALNRMGH